ncbi:MAG TPA: hemolysin family protein [Chloroflexota bacterium]|nr:hemolysin family protein [Chloroflexota bacterium]
MLAAPFSLEGLADGTLAGGSLLLGSVLLAGAFFVIAFLWAALETAVAAVRRVRLQQLVDEGAPGARRLQQLMENSSGFVAAARLVVTSSLIGGTTLLVAVAAVPLAERLGSLVGACILLVLLAIVLAVIPVQQVAPALGSREAEPISLALAAPARGTVWLLTPLVRLLNAIGSLIYAPSRQPGALPRVEAGTAAAVTEAQIMLQVDVAEEEGVLEEDEGQMIRSIFEFGDTVAREIMVPRIDIKAMPETATLAEAVDLAIASGHSRIPLYRDSVDDVSGIFYVKDSLRFFREGRLDIRVREVMREAHFVPETKKVDDLLQEMQSRRVHVAIIVDEYGGTAGLLTIEDILEEIVGEIQDEFDAEEAPFVQVSEHEVLVDALMTLDDVNDLLSLELQEEDVDTLGGLVYARLGRVPQQGDEVVIDGARLIVDEVEGNRINKVRIVTPESEAGPRQASSNGERHPDD